MTHLTLSNDALRKHGILPPREKPPTTPSPPPSPTLQDLLSDLTPSELGEDAADDDVARAIESHRRQRIAAAQREDKHARFGRVYPISREDYTREVTEASDVDEEEDDDEKGTAVVCFLYKDGWVVSPYLACILAFLTRNN